MTLEQFREELLALLRKAKEAGLDLDEICAVAEHVMENEWVS